MRLDAIDGATSSGLGSSLLSITSSEYVRPDPGQMTRMTVRMTIRKKGEGNCRVIPWPPSIVTRWVMQVLRNKRGLTSKGETHATDNKITFDAQLDILGSGPKHRPLSTLHEDGISERARIMVDLSSSSDALAANASYVDFTLGIGRSDRSVARTCDNLRHAGSTGASQGVSRAGFDRFP
jgi:hypothetical protein